MVKKLITTAIGAGLVLATVVPAFAANICNNQTTGPTSLNVCNRALTKMKTLTLNNTGTVTHNVISTANSGNNTANSNTSGGTVGAGAATGSVVKQASLNTGTIIAAQSDPASDDQGLNDTTGPSSNNTVTLNTTKTISLYLDNSGSLNQFVTHTVNSGNNTASTNTIGGMITTGTATSDVSIISIMNDFVIDLSQ